MYSAVELWVSGVPAIQLSTKPVEPASQALAIGQAADFGTNRTWSNAVVCHGSMHDDNALGAPVDLGRLATAARDGFDGFVANGLPPS